MTYRVVKRIKGIPYLYEQESFRIGGRVHTQCRSLGAVSGVSGASVGHAPARSGGIIGTGGSGGGSTPSPSEPPPKPEEPTPHPQLNIKIDPAKLHISETALRKEHEQAISRLRKIGIDPAGFPGITVRYGKAVGHHRKTLSGRSYVVTVPRWEKGNREKLRAEYRKGLGRATLDVVAQKRPDLMDTITRRFDASYRATQDALSRYIKATNDRNKRFKAIALKYFGMANPIYHVPPETVGLTEYGLRRDWRDEFASLYAHAQRKGYRRSIQDAQTELAKAQAEEKKAIEEKAGIFIFRRRRRLKRAIARIESQKELLNKLGILQPFFS